MGIVVMLVGTVTAIQGILSKCDLLWLLGIICLANGLLLSFRQEFPLWVRLVGGLVISGALGVVIYLAGVLDMLYMGRIAEYRYAAAEAMLVIGLNAVALLPDRLDCGKKVKHLTTRVNPPRH